MLEIRVHNLGYMERMFWLEFIERRKYVVGINSWFLKFLHQLCQLTRKEFGLTCFFA